MKKICVVGAPSTGKTTLAGALVNELKKRGHSVEWAKEYARDFILEQGAPKGIEDQLLIVQGQIKKEKEAESKNPRFIVCDGTPFICYIYCFLHRPKEEERLSSYNKILEEIWREVEDGIYNYDYVFFLPPEISFKEDGVRIYAEKVNKISDQIKDFLISKKIEHFEIRGPLEERANQVFKIIFEQ